MRSSAMLPPLQALRAFEAVARLKNFRRAGEELLITQSAVSHHIGGLERALGAKLFVRKARGIEVTIEGEQYFERIRHAFDVINSATSELRGSFGRERVRVSLLPSFAANWLVPRLHRFSALYPKIELVLDPTIRLADLTVAEADIAIRYGDAHRDGADSLLLLEEQLTPVASPSLLGKGQSSLSPSEILRHKLLFASPPYEWNIWANANNINLDSAVKIQLTDYNIVIQAATDGLGIALGRLSLIGERLLNGSLVQPLGSVVTSPRAGHWLSIPRRPAPGRAVKAFADWAIAEAGIQQSASRRTPLSLASPSK
jgi:LysR family glycine cleavage system transcriptional activator